MLPVVHIGRGVTTPASSAKHAGLEVVDEFIALASRHAAASQGGIHSALGQDGFAAVAGSAGDLVGLQEGICPPLVDGFAPTDPGLGVHLLHDVVDVDSRALCVNVSQRHVEWLQPIGYLPEIIPITHGDQPGVMDHQEGGAADADFIPRHGDERCGRGGQADDVHRDLALVLAQQVVNGQAFEHIAAGAVDIHGHIDIAAYGAQSASNAFCRDTFTGPPVVANRLVDGDRGVRVIARSCSKLRTPCI